MHDETLPLHYQNLNAEEKLSLLWSEKIVPTTYAVLPPIKFVSIVWKFFKLLNPSYLAVSFNLISDEFPKNRERLIHPNGAVAKVEWIADPDVQMSGIFETGAIGLVRLSLAGNPHAARSYHTGHGTQTSGRWPSIGESSGDAFDHGARKGSEFFQGRFQQHHP